MASWHFLYDQIVPYIVRIETPEGFGTGFLFAYNKAKTIVAFATAAHVVQHADSWKLPIKITHHATGKEACLTDAERVIELDANRDSASILTYLVPDYLPKEAPKMMRPTHLKKVGVEVAWAGYPVIARPSLCLFTGSVAAFVAYDDSYLIDGVAINGVSGGPVFGATDEDEDVPEIIGTVSSYIPNRQPGDTFPGMARAHDITSFANVVSRMKSLDEAREAKERDEEQKRKAEAAGDVAPDAVQAAPTKT